MIDKSSRFVSTFTMILTGFFLMALNLLILSSFQQIEHEIKVKVDFIPVFAVSSNDNKPVLDLQKEEIHLFINGKKVEVMHLIQKEFLFPVEMESEWVAKESKAKEIYLEQHIFIVMDSVFTTPYGVNRTKQIVEKIIKESNTYDRFSVFLISPHRGLVPLTGPEPRSEELLNKLKKTVIAPLTVLGDSPPIYPPEDFIDALCSLESVLVKYNKPKIVYLISGGYIPSRYAVFNSQKIIDAINRGGASLFTVNPGRIQSLNRISGSHMLDYLARETGGQYFQGIETKSMIERIKKTVSAYYEVVFDVADIPDKKNSKVTIICSRKGIRLLKPGNL